MGGSLGGMLALEFAAMYPAFTRSLICIAAPARTSAWALSFSALQRAMLDQPGGIGLARMLAMISYRSPASYDQKFGRALQPPGKENPLLSTLVGAGETHTIHSYLAHQGNKFDSRFDPVCYAHITHKLDGHDILRARTESEELPAVGSPLEMDELRRVLQDMPRTLVVGIESDCLFPVAELQRLVDALPRAEMFILRSNDGHDGFLIEQAALGRAVDKFLEES